MWHRKSHHFSFQTYKRSGSSLRTRHTTAARSALRETQSISGPLRYHNLLKPSCLRWRCGTHSSSTSTSRSSSTELTSGSSLALLTIRSGGSLRSRVTLKKRQRRCSDECTRFLASAVGKFLKHLKMASTYRLSLGTNVSLNTLNTRISLKQADIKFIVNSFSVSE